MEKTRVPAWLRPKNIQKRAYEELPPDIEMETTAAYSDAGGVGGVKVYNWSKNREHAERTGDPNDLAYLQEVQETIAGVFKGDVWDEETGEMITQGGKPVPVGKTVFQRPERQMTQQPQTTQQPQVQTVQQPDQPVQQRQKQGPMRT